MTALKYLREKSGLSRKEVSELCGINLRSLQDYEQGHKDIIHAKGELLYKLSMTLGCSVENLLEPYLLKEHPIADRSRDLKYLDETDIKSDTYKVHGKWICTEDHYTLIFIYQGRIIELPFPAIFTDQTLPWLAEAAVMKMESYIEGVIFDANSLKLEGDEWDEW